MHSKRKGNIGQTAVAKELTKLGYSVFVELGDISKIDLIAEKNGKILRIQCKAITSKKGKVSLPLSKSGPNYKFKYTKEMFDYFAVYVLDRDVVAFISSEEALKNTNTINLRLDAPKNKQLKGVKLITDFQKLENN